MNGITKNNVIMKKFIPVYLIVSSASSKIRKPYINILILLKYILLDFISNKAQIKDKTGI